MPETEVIKPSTDPTDPPKKRRQRSLAKTRRKAPKSAFKPGKSGNPAGRPKGSKNHVPAEFREYMAAVLAGENIRELMAARVAAELADENSSCPFTRWAGDQVYGKPRQSVEVRGNAVIAAVETSWEEAERIRRSRLAEMASVAAELGESLELIEDSDGSFALDSDSRASRAPRADDPPSTGTLGSLDPIGPSRSLSGPEDPDEPSGGQD